MRYKTLGEKEEKSYSEDGVPTRKNKAKVIGITIFTALILFLCIFFTIQSNNKKEVTGEITSEGESAVQEIKDLTLKEMQVLLEEGKYPLIMINNNGKVERYPAIPMFYAELIRINQILKANGLTLKE